MPSVGNLDTNLQQSQQPPVFRTSRPKNRTRVISWWQLLRAYSPFGIAVAGIVETQRVRNDYDNHDGHQDPDAENADEDDEENKD